MFMCVRCTAWTSNRYASALFGVVGFCLHPRIDSVNDISGKTARSAAATETSLKEY